MEHRINRKIPDPGGVRDFIPFPLEAKIKDIEINVDIRHTWRGDLRIILTSPQGTEIVLHDRTGSSKDDIIASYRSTNEKELFAPLLGKSAKGDWSIKVIDNAPRDVGVIIKWGISITY